LVELGYAPTPAEVVRFLVQREIDDMKRTSLLPKVVAAPKSHEGDDTVPG
jgi:hypothetical protein